MNTPSELEKKASKLTDSEALRLESITKDLGAILRTKEFTEENRKTVEGKGGIMLTTTHAFGGVHRSLYRGEGPPPPLPVIGDVIAMTLRMFGQGMKVACEIAAMAADAGMVRTDEEIIAIGGTGRGADTAVVLQPEYVHRFFNLKVKELICKPRL